MTHRDLKGITVSRAALAGNSITAGAGNDGVKLTGETIDTLELGNPQTCVFEVIVTAALAATKGVTVVADVEHSDNGSSWTKIVDAEAVYSVTAEEAATITGVGRIGVDLQMAKRYIRLRPTVDLSNTGTDTAISAAVCIFAGLDTVPLE